MAMPTNHKGVFLSKHRPDGHRIPLCIGMCLFGQRAAVAKIIYKAVVVIHD